MSPTQDPALWARLETWMTSADHGALRLRVIEDLRMSAHGIEAVLSEYARYCYLVVAVDDTLPPPPLLAQIARLHADNDSMAAAFARDVLGRALPAIALDQVPLRDPGHTRARTAYTQTFGAQPSTDVWHRKSAAWNRAGQIVFGLLTVGGLVAIVLNGDALSDGQLMAAVVALGAVALVFFVLVMTGPRRAGDDARSTSVDTYN